MQSKTLTVLFADITKFTAKTESQTRQQIQSLMKEIFSFVSIHCARHDGNLVKSLGDGFMLTFESPSNAVKCAIEIQEKLKSRNAYIFDAENIVQLRIGISTGEVVINDAGDIFGDSVNIAARIQSSANPNDVIISESTYWTLNHNELKLASTDLGTRKFKNVSREIRVYKVTRDADRREIRSKSLPKTITTKRKMIITLAISCLLLGGICFWGLSWFISKKPVPVGSSSPPTVSEKTSQNEPVKKQPPPADWNGQNVVLKTWIEPSTGIEFVWVDEGCYDMGCVEGNESCKTYFPHKVCVDGFYMGKFEVTQKEWIKLMLNNTSIGSIGSQYPMDSVSWHDAMEFLRSLNNLHQNKFKFRLPTEAEWEFAARDRGKPYLYAGGRDVSTVGWYENNIEGTTHIVGRKSPNELGCFDMSGNLFEWCEDTFVEDAYKRHKKHNPVIKEDGKNKVVRGGSWADGAAELQTTTRYSFPPSLRILRVGFRIVREK